MSGVRLQVRVNLITAATSCVQNVIRCVERCGLSVADVVLEPLASAEAVLSEDEKEIGVAVIDIGGGTTDLLLYVEGGIAHTSVIPVGRQQRHQRRRRRVFARRWARPSVSSATSAARSGAWWPTRRKWKSRASADTRRASAARRVLSDIIEPRVEEIFALVRKRIEDTGHARSSSRRAQCSPAAPYSWRA